MSEPRDPSDPLSPLRDAAAAGEPSARFRLATALVLQGQAGEAFELHRQAARDGHPGAQVEHARMLLHGVGTGADTGQAVESLLQAEAAGNAVAGYLLALIALGGVALPRDGRINQWMMAAIRHDYPPALRAAAIHFGRYPDPADQARCLGLLERAASRGDAIAAQLLAERLHRGEGCPAQPEGAARLRAQLQQHGIGTLPAIELPIGSAGTPPSIGTTSGRELAFEDGLAATASDTLCESPRVRRIDNLLSADECRLLIASAMPGLRRSRTVDPATGVPVERELRTSSDSVFDPVTEDFALRALQLRMVHAAGVELLQAEHMVVLRYEPGQEYLPHRDYRPPGSLEQDRPEAGNRLRTICTYLNDVTAGGETVFPEAGLQVDPAPGRAIVFDNLHADGSPDPASLHAGLPVRQGEKWLATLWLRQGRYRTA